MSQENVEIVRAAIEAGDRGDWDAVFKDAAPGFEYDMTRAVGPGRTVHDLDQARGQMAEFVGTWASSRIEPHEFIEVGPHVVVPWTAHFTGRDGIEVQVQAAWTFTIRHRKIERMCLYQDRGDALEAAGLSE
jgi:ketosteroid isomerase-like protein